ncbi:hypothetical protein [Paracidovorax konjaci]|uniref:hypothetical protein n=1 Tax=Paracidovorax konjaci TaxID=32040 RepID=UPI0015875F4D|nr:hypothetical protein [Paracidovorax konjaci]
MAHPNPRPSHPAAPCAALRYRHLFHDHAPCQPQRARRHARPQPPGAGDAPSPG